MSKSHPPVAVIAGPTASGKSALALRLAEQSGGVVINADSAQVYADLQILSARPNAEEMARAPHRLFGSWDGAFPCSAADWAVRAKAEVASAHQEGRLPILVGGTGLYLRTLLDGIAPVPSIDEDIRTEVRARAVADNHRQLAELDPHAARRLHPSDSSRIARALEVVRSTGRALGAWQSERHGGIADRVDLRAIILLPPREWLYRRCNGRFADMLTGGALEEVRALLDRRLDPELPVMRAIGVREVAAMLDGERMFEEVLADGARATRNYAKRQYTWFSHQPPPAWSRFEDPLETDDIADRALALLDWTS